MSRIGPEASGAQSSVSRVPKERARPARLLHKRNGRGLPDSCTTFRGCGNGTFLPDYCALETAPVQCVDLGTLASKLLEIIQMLRGHHGHDCTRDRVACSATMCQAAHQPAPRETARSRPSRPEASSETARSRPSRSRKACVEGSHETTRSGTARLRRQESAMGNGMLRQKKKKPLLISSGRALGITHEHAWLFGKRDAGLHVHVHANLHTQHKRQSDAKSMR